MYLTPWPGVKKKNSSNNFGTFINRKPNLTFGTSEHVHLTADDEILIPGDLFKTIDLKTKSTEVASDCQL